MPRLGGLLGSILIVAAGLSVMASVAQAAAPQRVASLNLCTDELLLALAAPGQIISITHLSQDPREAVHWRTARRFPANDGSLMSVAMLRPDLILATGGGARDRELIAGAIGAKLLALPYPEKIEDVEHAITLVSVALHRPEAGQRLIGAIRAAQATMPRRRHDVIFLSGGGRTLPAGGLGAQWLRLAGLEQRAMRGDLVDAETMLTAPPRLLVRSDYRRDQNSREQQWLQHPLLRRVRAPVVSTDGRRWTCMGPTLLPEVLRLRKVAAQLGKDAQR